MSTHGVVIAQSPGAPDLRVPFWELLVQHHQASLAWFDGDCRQVEADVFWLPADPHELPGDDHRRRVRSLAEAEAMVVLLTEAHALPGQGWAAFEAAARAGAPVDACLRLAVDASRWPR